MAKVSTNWAKTAEAIKQGKSVMVKTVYRNDGSTTDIYTDDSPDNDFEYLGSAEDEEPELELDFEDTSEDIIEQNKDNMEALAETYNEVKEDGRYYLDEDDTASGVLMKYYSEMLGNHTFTYLRMLKADNTSNWGYFKGLAKTVDLRYAKEVTKAFTSKLSIPFKDAKRLFDLPYKMNSWKDLKVNKQMNKEEKGLVRFLKQLHGGNSNALVNAIKDIKHGRELPKGVSELDVKKLSIIMLSKYKKKGKK